MIAGVVAGGRPLAGSGGGGSAHRYWRLDITAAQTSGYTRVGEIELRTTSGGANLPISVGGSATASNQYTPVSRAFDGSIAANTNDWIAAGASSWAVWDFGAGNAQVATEFTLRNTDTGNGAEQQQHARNYTVSYSDDGSAWTLCGIKFGHPSGASASSALSLSSSAITAGYRYYRLYITANSGGAAYTALSNLELIDATDLDITTGISGNASASSNYPGEIPAHAFDDATSPWVTNDGLAIPSWIKIDLKQLGVVASFAITSQSGSPERAPANFELQGSNDNSSWTTVKSVSGQTGWASLERRVFTV